MTIAQALDRVDQQKPNMISADMKISFLIEIDQVIHEELVLTHEHTLAEEVKPQYDRDTDPGTELIMPSPYDKLYEYWLMARIDLETDRSGLDPGILVKITDASVGNCPSSVTLFPGSEATDCFTRGFTHSNTEVEGLNQSGGLVSLYVLENCSGSTYVEIKAEYHSDEFHTEPGERISYKIPLEELRRNTVYPVTISLSGKLEGNLSSKEW